MGKKQYKVINEEQEDTIVVEKESIKEPRRYTIVMYNDDYTTQEFVVHVLKNFLHQSLDDAHRIMMKVHLEGKAQVGLYSKDVAESKVSLIISYCRQNGMPLMLTVEPLS